MIRIALLGFGNVGRSFLRYLAKTGADSDVQVWAIADVTGGLILNNAEDAHWLLQEQQQGRTVADCAERGSFSKVSSFIYHLPEADISVLVECMPTNPVDGQPALGLLKQAIDAGLHVVTVDKGPLVHGFHELVSEADRQGKKLAYSGTTGVRPPVGITGCHVMEIRGILNGTTNFILTEMQDRDRTFKQALALAVENGIAEPNPELDLQGWDTACKLLILANEWMRAGASLNDVARIGIGPETESLIAEARGAGRYVRLVGLARMQEGRPRLTVAPVLLKPQSRLHPISGTSKGAIFATRERGEVFASGVSGRDAIAQIILDDIVAVTAPKPSIP